MKVLIILSIIMVFFSCQKEKESFNNDTGIEISIKNNVGDDLLNPLSPNSFIESSIKIYYLIDGETKEVYNPNYDYPRNFKILEKEGKYYMIIWPNGAEKEEFPITYIKWNESDTDTLKCGFSRTEKSVICTKIWYNEILVWDDYSNCRCFQIVK